MYRRIAARAANEGREAAPNYVRDPSTGQVSASVRAASLGCARRHLAVRNGRAGHHGEQMKMKMKAHDYLYELLRLWREQGVDEQAQTEAVQYILSGSDPWNDRSRNFAWVRGILKVRRFRRNERKYIEGFWNSRICLRMERRMKRDASTPPLSVRLEQYREMLARREQARMWSWITDHTE